MRKVLPAGQKNHLDLLTSKSQLDQVVSTVQIRGTQIQILKGQRLKGPCIEVGQARPLK